MYHKAGRRFASLDLSKATDGLSHDAVHAAVEALCARGLIRPTDLTMAKRSLGLERGAFWSFPDLGDEVGEGTFLRGSPMGTPLSFVVLSWVNAWATSAFERSLHHGDDAVGRYRVKAGVSFELTDLGLYGTRIASVGAALNRAKTFLADHSWTACERLALPGEDDEGMVVFKPPSIPDPALRTPVVADMHLEPVYMNRMERVMKTRFPWLCRDPRLHLPVSVGGLGYTGRGLACSVAVRTRLARLVSTHVDDGGVEGVALALLSKKPFREEGLFPRPFERVLNPKSFWKATKAVEPWFQKPDQGGETAPLEAVLAFKSCLIEDEVRLAEGSTFKRRKVVRRPERTKMSSVFKHKPAGVVRIRPLSRANGCAALDRFVERLKGRQITLDNDIVAEIREKRCHACCATPTNASRRS
jgi:hypothetical protein